MLCVNRCVIKKTVKSLYSLHVTLLQMQEDEVD